jgi:Zn finger protein HypA/HybF involved in hydrogenase expression
MLYVYTVTYRKGDNMEIAVIELECKRCNHKWHPRKREVVICPKCKSPYWNRKRVRKE